MSTAEAKAAMETCSQNVASGPEYNKNLSFGEVHAETAAEIGLGVHQWKTGPSRDCLVYSAAICLNPFVGRGDSLQSAANEMRKVFDSGKALAHLEAANT